MSFRNFRIFLPVFDGKAWDDFSIFFSDSPGKVYPELTV